jgi:hypothetical protein
VNHCCKCGSDRFTTLWWSPVQRYVAMVECDSCSYRWRWRVRWPGAVRDAAVLRHIACRDGFHPEKRYNSLEEIKRDLFPRLHEQEQLDTLRRAREDAEQAEEVRADATS